MIFLVERLNEQGNPVLGSEGRFIFKNKYKSLESLERYALSWILKKYPRVWVSVYNAQNIYGTANKVFSYSMENGYIRSGQIYPVKSI